MKIMAVVLTLLLAVSLAFATHMDSVGDNDLGTDNNDDTDSTTRTSDSDCTDVNPYDSIDQCVGRETVSDRMISSTQTTSDTWTSSGIERTSDSEWITLRCRAGDETDVWECTMVDDTQATSDRIVNGNTFTTSRGSWSDMYDYNNPDRVTTGSVDDNMTVEEDSETRGFESPVVYRNDLNTDRTSPEQAD